MTLTTKIRALSLLLLACSTAGSAQTTAGGAPRRKSHARPYQPPFNPSVVVLDPAHGGDDSGANLGKGGPEKDFDFAFAVRLRDLLQAQGFTVVLTHEAADDNVAADQRVEIANRARAVACLLLHASNTGQGVHLFTSSLTAQAADDSRAAEFIAPWDSAQAASLARSQQLANEIATSLNGLKIPLLAGSASVSPIDSMSCPAVALEIAAPSLKGNIADETYQQHIAQSLTTALTYWRQRAKDQIAAAEAASQAAGDKASPGAPQTPTARPKPKPRPVTPNVPDEMPLAPDAPAPKPAPIERRPPAATPASPAAIPPTAQTGRKGDR